MTRSPRNRVLSYLTLSKVIYACRFELYLLFRIHNSRRLRLPPTCRDDAGHKFGIGGQGIEVGPRVVGSRRVYVIRTYVVLDVMWRVTVVRVVPHVAVVRISANSRELRHCSRRSGVVRARRDLPVVMQLVRRTRRLLVEDRAVGRALRRLPLLRPVEPNFIFHFLALLLGHAAEFHS